MDIVLPLMFAAIECQSVAFKPLIRLLGIARKSLTNAYFQIVT